MSWSQGQSNAGSSASLSNRPSSLRPTEKEPQLQNSGSEQASSSPLQSLKGGNKEVSPGDLSTGQANFQPASSGPVLKEAASTATQAGSSPLQSIKGTGDSTGSLIKDGPVDTGVGDAQCLCELGLPQVALTYDRLCVCAETILRLSLLRWDAYKCAAVVAC